MPSATEDTFQLEQDVKAFARQLRLREYFWDEDASKEGHTINPFQKKLSWVPPPNRDPALETFIKAVKDDVLEAEARGLKRYRRNNLTSAPLVKLPKRLGH